MRISRPSLQRRDEDIDRPPLRLVPVSVALIGTFLTAISIAVLVFFTGLQLLDVRGIQSERQLSSKTLFDLVKLAFGVVAGAGALVALVVAYRRQRVDETAALREATKLHTDRFSVAVEQLGSGSPAVQLGGVHALAGLADDAPTRALRQTCIDVLCAFLRLPYDPDPGEDPNLPPELKAFKAVREVRHTVIRIIGNHLRMPKDDRRSWQGHDFDLSNVVFDGGDLTGAVFSGGVVDFRAAEFRSGSFLLQAAEFSGGRVIFGGAKFTGGWVALLSANFSAGAVIFDDADVVAGTVHIEDGTFSGGNVSFRRATFLGGEVRFRGANFSGTSVRFEETRLEGGNVDFEGVAAATVSFEDATFSGGTVDFSNAHGFVPRGLVPAPGEPLPQGLHLPPEWVASSEGG